MYQPRASDKTFRLHWPWVFLAVCGLIIVFGLIRFRPGAHLATDPKPPGAMNASPEFSAQPVKASRVRPALVPGHTADAIVAEKLAQFAKSRREFAHALARRHDIQVPQDVERFFAAIESGNWGAIEAAFKKINGSDSSSSWNKGRSEDVNKLWPAIIDAYGVAEQVHLWPAQQLLDYGNALLGVLRPGMVYVGGTDNGRWIPELLNETSDGERHIIITQNGLADATYLDYVRLQYDDRLANLSEEDSKRAFEQYLADAQKRLAHDQQFPDEPKQIRPGEDISIRDNRVQVGGKVAVMAINERLLQMLMEKNPGVSFALQESFPLHGTYGDALPLGPLMELRAGDEQITFTAERAAQSLDYWRSSAQQVLSDPEALSSEAALKSYSHDTAAAANLLAAHNFSAEAEEAYRLAVQLWPANPESVIGLADLLARTDRGKEAREVLADFARKYPDQRKALEDSGAAALIFLRDSGER
jgi:hypothetical protein